MSIFCNMRKYLNITHKALSDYQAESYQQLWQKAQEQGYEGLTLNVHSEYTKAEDSENKFHAIFSSANEDRHGDVVHQEFDIKSFKKNPVFLDSHNYGSIERIIGRVQKIKVTDGKLQGDIEFFTDNPLGALAMKAADQGFLGATSIGFIPREFSDKGEMLKSELLEVSAVSVPANADALFEKSTTPEETVAVVEVPEEEAPAIEHESTPEPLRTVTSVDRKAIAARAIKELDAQHRRTLRSLARSVRELVEDNKRSKKREIYKRIRQELEM